MAIDEATPLITELASRERRPLTQDQRRRVSERRLLDAATDLVAEKGAAKLTLAAIGDRAGYSRGMVTERFGSKRGLMAALVVDIQDRVTTQILEPAIAQKRGLPAIEACIDATLIALGSDDRVGLAFLTLIGESLALDPELRSGLARVGSNFRRRFAIYVEEAIDDGSIRSTDSPTSSAFLLLGVLIGLATQYLVDREATSIESMQADAHRFLDGLVISSE
jgi:AcrR family transcriptional regulator